VKPLVLAVPKPVEKELEGHERKLKEEMTEKKLRELEERNEAAFKRSKC